MAQALARGEIWLVQLGAPDKRRPALILSRSSLLEVLQTATVVPITSTLRGSPTEVQLGTDEGLKGPCCANLTNVLTVRRSQLRRFVGTVGHAKMRQVCDALAIACGCD